MSPPSAPLHAFFFFPRRKGMAKPSSSHRHRNADSCEADSRGLDSPSKHVMLSSLKRAVMFLYQRLLLLIIRIN